MVGGGFWDKMMGGCWGKVRKGENLGLMRKGSFGKGLMMLIWIGVLIGEVVLE